MNNLQNQNAEAFYDIERLCIFCFFIKEDSEYKQMRFCIILPFLKRGVQMKNKTFRTKLVDAENN